MGYVNFIHYTRDNTVKLFEFILCLVAIKNLSMCILSRYPNLIMRTTFPSNILLVALSLIYKPLDLHRFLQICRKRFYITSCFSAFFIILPTPLARECEVSHRNSDRRRLFIPHHSFSDSHADDPKRPVQLPDSGLSLPQSSGYA